MARTGRHVTTGTCGKHSYRSDSTELWRAGMVRNLEVFPGMPEYRDGYVYANDRPGLGVDIDEKEAAKYPCENTVTTWTQTRNRDGALVTP